MRRISIVLCLILFGAAACQPTTGQVAFLVTLPPQADPLAAQRVSTAVPTVNRQPTRTPVSLATNTAAPTNTGEPTQTPAPARTSVPIASPTRNSTPADPDSTPLPTWTPPPDDPATRIEDHYRMRRPVADGLTNWVDRTYPYGSTQGGQLQTHHGVEFANPRGTPVLAVADGTVYYAGEDLTQLFGPIPNYYGRLVVIRHDFQSPQGEPVFSLYGHLERWDVQTGDRVAQGDQVGLVGATGVAQGPHVHLEVRVGDPNSFDATRNPELWIYPFQRFGTLAGRVTDASGAPLYDVTVQVRSPNLARYAFTYADDSVNPDPAFGENFALGDLPPNYYDVSVTADGVVRFRKTIYVYANRTTWIDIQLN